MSQAFAFILDRLSSAAWGPLCHLHLHGRSGGPDGLPDPHLDAFFMGVLVTILYGIGTMLFCSPFLIIRTRRLRDIFWVVPVLNLALYFLGIATRAYPGGFLARFRPPGLWYTLVEIGIVLGLSLIVALVTALVWWAIRKARAMTKPTQAPVPPKIEPQPLRSRPVENDETKFKRYLLGEFFWELEHHPPLPPEFVGVRQETVEVLTFQGYYEMRVRIADAQYDVELSWRKDVPPVIRNVPKDGGPETGFQGP